MKLKTIYAQRTFNLSPGTFRTEVWGVGYELQGDDTMEDVVKALKKQIWELASPEAKQCELDTQSKLKAKAEMINYKGKDVKVGDTLIKTQSGSAVVTAITPAKTVATSPLDDDLPAWDLEQTKESK